MKYALINGRILNGHQDMQVIEHQVVVVEDGYITALLDDDADLSGYQIVDLKGKYLMPGLVNMHVHLPASGKPQKKQSDPKKLVALITRNQFMRQIGIKLCTHYAQMQLSSGVTTIRTMGGVADFDTQIRDAIQAGKVVGPRILAANMAISVEDGHMAGSLAYIAHSAKEASQYVDQIAKDRPDIIKLMITGGVLDARVEGEPGELKMPAEWIKAACDQAHARGLKVASHVESTEGVKQALLNGVDTIEHGARLTPELVALFKKRQACHIATLSPALPYALFDPAVSHVSQVERHNGQIVFQGIIDCARTCLENGIPVGLGTDTGCPYITQYDMWRELCYFHHYCGVSNAFALYTATLLNAKLAGIDQITGSIDVGKSADLIVTAENPLEQLEALRHVEMVMIKGQFVKPLKVKKMPQVERELDRFLPRD